MMTPINAKHICFSITHHGFGHGAISTSVIAALQQQDPTIKISILSTLPDNYFRARLSQDYTLIPIGSDFGMTMHSAISVDVPASEEKYLALLANWHDKQAQEQAVLTKLKPDLVVSNISPVTLAAAAELGVPSISLCPFNWSQILQSYSQHPVLAKELIPLMDRAYQKAQLALKPTPHVPNPKQANEQEIGPIAQHGQPRKVDLWQALSLSSTTKIGLIALGGLTVPIDLTRWPKHSGWLWLVDQAIPDSRTDMCHYTTPNMAFLDLVFSVDLVITKPGYGTYTELAAAGTKAITLMRPDWPETPYLNTYLAEHVSCAQINPEQLTQPAFMSLIEQVSNQANPPSKQSENGALKACQIILAQLNSTCR
ncbi:hypothetical protein [Motilimonas eburnea]|uniref:hypothetical protein n=1 Tax=Motilimonas eburnea TaxID=1737488 RepID=UPI001E50093E|nr:hypothetical protein [Motilimonas eburnea]MCE2572451.1 hypothetical protein [Motilimonas eburnea]